MAKSRKVKDRGNPVANAAVIAWESVTHPFTSTAFVVEDGVFHVRTGLQEATDFASRTSPSGEGPGPQSPAPVEAAFKLVFGSVVIITILAIVAYVALSMTLPDDINETKKQALDFAKMIGQTGFGAVVGLLGGKVVK